MSDDAMRLLENLTPGGSEFFNDPKRCAEWVERRLSETHRITVAAVKARNDAQSRAEAAEQQAARLRSAMSQLVGILGPASCRCDGQQEEVSQALDVIRATLAASQPAPAADDERGGQAEGEG